MSFSLELCIKNNVVLTLSVVRDQIIIAFTKFDDTMEKGADLKALELFSSLVRSISMPEEKDWIRGKDDEHYKRHHVSPYEGRTLHLHIGFNQEIMPDVLERFLTNLLKQQKLRNHEFQFIHEPNVEYVVHVYKHFLREFLGSNLARQCREERRLSESEKASLMRQATKEFDGYTLLSGSDRRELRASGFNLSSIKKHGVQLASAAFFSRMKEIEDVQSGNQPLNDIIFTS